MVGFQNILYLCSVQMNEAADSVGSTRQLDRQISTLYYDRLNERTDGDILKKVVFLRIIGK